jgi:hypothetical protein
METYLDGSVYTYGTNQYPEVGYWFSGDRGNTKTLNLHIPVGMNEFLKFKKFIC